MLYCFQQQVGRTVSMAAYSIGQLVSEIFVESNCADGPREDGTASVPRGAAKLLMSETSPSPPLKFYSCFQNPKLNTQTPCCITASIENPVDAAKCVCMCMYLCTCAMHLKDTYL